MKLQLLFILVAIASVAIAQTVTWEPLDVRPFYVDDLINLSSADRVILEELVSAAVHYWELILKVRSLGKNG